jgi:V/A-type H+-transporting ATPase subunit K
MLLGAGVLGGLAMGMSAWFQGRTGAVASDALAETGQGFGQYIMVMGIVETVALFVMVFLLTIVG